MTAPTHTDPAPPPPAREPPGPAPWWGVPALLATRRDQLQWLRRMKDRFGDVVQFRVWNHRFVQVNRPDLMERVLIKDAAKFIKGPSLRKLREVLGEGLLTSEGELHLRQRRLIQPAFRSDAVERYGERMIPCITDLCDAWSDRETLCIYEEMKWLTTAIICQVLFGLRIERAEAARVDRLARDVLALLAISADPVPGALRAMGFPIGRRYESAKQELETLFDALLRRCERDRLHERDPMMLLEGAATGRQLRDEIIILLFSGYETTSLSLTWAWYLISQHPEVEARLHAELDGLPYPIRGEHLPRLEWTGRIIRESLRLYPPGFALMRTATADYPLDGYTIPAGATLVMSQYLVQRDPRYYDDPESFRPERWTPEFRASLPRCAFVPFSAGPRVCIGEALAWRELTLVVANVARRWRVEHAPGHRVEIAPRFHLYPKHGMRMVVHARDPHEGSAHG